MIKQIRYGMKYEANMEETVTDQLKNWGFSSGQRLDIYDYLVRNKMMRFEDEGIFFFTMKGVTQLNKYFKKGQRDSSEALKEAIKWWSN